MAEAMPIEQPHRWDVPFSREVPDPRERRDMTDSDVNRLLSIEPFAHMDPANFPRHQPLRDIIRYDTRIRRYRNGAVVVRQGDYGNSAFLILRGRVRVMLQGLDASVLGRRERQKKSWLRSLIDLATNPRSPEVRDPRRYQQAAQQTPDKAADQDVEWAYVQGVTNVLEVMPDAFERTRNSVMEEGELFGELAALGRIPRAATLIADGEAELLEIRWQGLRDLRKHDEQLRRYVDDRYRQFGLAATLRASPLLQHLTEEQAQKVAKAAVFETYGSYDWYGSYQQLRRKQVDPLKKEPIIAQQGHYPNGLVLNRAGFARLSQAHGHGELTFSYLGKGDIYGLAELIYNARYPHEPTPLLSTLRAIGYVDVVRIPTRTFEELILPGMDEQLIQRLIDAVPTEAEPEASQTPTDQRVAVTVPDPESSDEARSRRETIDPGMMEFLVENRFINGTSTMMIDMDRCTRCDDCVRACADGHGNNPLFVRHGPTYNNVMVTNACMHCVDPVCMIGCPTGAIHRVEETGEVTINDVTCIGCGVCAASCPYDNIRMVEIRDGTNDDAPMVDPMEGTAIRKATKCDLCEDHPGGPACQRACPHDALKRVDMRDQKELARWLNR